MDCFEARTNQLEGQRFQLRSDSDPYQSSITEEKPNPIFSSNDVSETAIAGGYVRSGVNVYRCPPIITFDWRRSVRYDNM